MRLVIERDGGYDVIEDSDKVKAVDVGGNIVSVRIGAMSASESFRQFPRATAGEAKALARAIAVRCGVLVEPLAEAPSNGLEDAQDDDAMGAVMAGRVRKVASQWVEGEPPRDGRLYVVTEGFGTLCVDWRDGKWRCGGMVAELGKCVAHLPTPIPNR